MCQTVCWAGRPKIYGFKQCTCAQQTIVYSVCLNSPPLYTLLYAYMKHVNAGNFVDSNIPIFNMDGGIFIILSNVPPRLCVCVCVPASYIVNYICVGASFILDASPNVPFALIIMDAHIQSGRFSISNLCRCRNLPFAHDCVIYDAISVYMYNISKQRACVTV